MKTKLTALLLAGLAFSPAAPLFAGPPSSYYETLRRAHQFEQLKTGDKVLYVCTQCQTVTEQTVESTTQAMEYCKEDATVTCPSCRKTSRVVFVGPPKNPSTKREVKYVNEKGEECLFFVKPSAQK
jgi:hypothetical protein